MIKRIFIPALLVFGFLMFAVSFYFNHTDEVMPYDYFRSAVKFNFWFVLFYFFGFFGFYYFIKKIGFTIERVSLFCLVFLLISPTIKSSTIIVRDGEYHTPVFEKESQINPGTPYNKLSCFAISAVSLLTIKGDRRFEQTYYDTYQWRLKRLGALNQSNSYQLHFFSVLVNFLFFVLLFFVLGSKCLKRSQVEDY